MILSIVIVNWNHKELTKKCIESITASSGDKIVSRQYEVVVIDNGSSDGSAEYLSTLQYKIKLILNEQNIGYSPACNLGMRAASGKYVLLLGNDTIIKNGALEKCVEFLESNNDSGAVGCKLLNPDGTAQNNCKRFPTLRNALFTYLSLDRFNKDYDMDWFDYNSTREVEQISTTFLMIRKDILETIKYFNEEYRILYNDVDLCQRIRQTGHKIYFLHTAEVVHFGSQSTKKAQYRLRKTMYSDIYRYYRNVFGLKAVILLPILLVRLLLVSAVKKR